MNPTVAVKINYLVGSMMLEFVRRFGPIRPNEDPSSKASEVYYHMEEKRKEISETLIDYLDANEEQKVIEGCNQ
jgi:hypothetical protein